MNKFCFLLFFTCVCLVFQSCNGNQEKIRVIFDEVENIVEQYPDSALILLESIRNPYELSKSQHAKYVLLSVQAKDKADKNIASDSLIFQAKEYFQKENDGRSLALAEFYCGRVLQSQGKIEESMETYLKAKDKATKIKDIHLCGLADFFLGNLNYHQFLYDEAISHYKSAAINFSHIEDKYKNQIASYTSIGNSFLLKSAADSAFFYYRKGLDLAKIHKDSAILIRTLHNVGVAFLKFNEIDSAKNTTLQVLSLAVNNDILQAKSYLNLAKIYHQESKNDSAIFYSNQALNLSKNDNSLKLSIYKLSSKIEESNKNYKKSLEYHTQYSKYLSSVVDETKEFNILDIQKKYDFELLQNANKKLVIQRLWIFILLILGLTAAFFAVYRTRTRNEKALLTAKQQIYLLKEMFNKKEEDSHNSIDETNLNTNNELREILFKQLNTLKKISLLESYLRDEEKEKGKEVLKKVNEIIYDSNNQFNWEIFYQPVNTLYDDFLTHLRCLYPALTEEEILICCLSKIGFDNNEIALLTKSNVNIVLKRKSVIRQKTGMKKQENFLRQLDEIVKIAQTLNENFKISQ